MHIITFRQAPFLSIPFFRFARTIVEFLARNRKDSKKPYDKKDTLVIHFYQNHLKGSICIAAIMSLISVIIICLVFGCGFYYAGIVVMVYFLLSYFFILYDMKFEDVAYKHKNKIWNVQPLVQVIAYFETAILLILVVFTIVFLTVA